MAANDPQDAVAVPAGGWIRRRLTRWFQALKALYPDHRGDPQPETVRDRVIARAQQVVADRRAVLDRMAADGTYPKEELPTEKDVPYASMGIAFSGGGIRSATISLGVAQAFAAKGRLLDFDYCSTVSGGGYLGSFLISLFLPDSARGPKGVKPAANMPQAARDSLNGELAAKANFAREALTSRAREDELPHPAVAQGKPTYGWVRNPIWWLREHSRYLAPNGSSDYAIGATYMVRNWFAMIYVFVLPLLLAAVLLIAMTNRLLAHPAVRDVFERWHLLWEVEAKTGKTVAVCKVAAACITHGVSPVFFAAAFTLFLTLGMGFAYWLTEFMGEASPFSKNVQKWLFRREFLKSRARLLSSVLLAGAVIAAIGAMSMVMLPRLAPDYARTGQFSDLSILAITIILGEAVATVSIATAAAAGLVSLLGDGRRDDAYTADVRKRITRWTSMGLLATLFLLFIAIIDMTGLELHARLIAGPSPTDPVSALGALSVLVTPAIAWLINKLPGWFGGKDGGVTRILGRHIWTIALLAGAVIVVSLTLLAHVGAQMLIFEKRDWLGTSLTEAETCRLCLLFLFTLVLTVLTGFSTGFINLSSLHSIYASRLTRAYIGGSNVRRLADSANPDANTSIKETHPQDQIAVEVYQQTRSAAPIHLINVTLNETRSREKSQLLERDRKGVPVVFAPEGVFIDAGKKITHQQYYDWASLSAHQVESLSVGQLCAISGAAASSAMGSRTTLGGALAMTLANIRLGYWWNVDHMIRERQPVGRSPIDVLGYFGNVAWRWGTRPFRTYFYLLNEARASYSRQYGRLNISDGGHFENSGAYELLRRRVRTILVCDNGADPSYAFEDLEQLVRKARIDLSLYIRVCRPDEVVELVGTKGAKLFLNGGDGDWRQRGARRTTDGVGASMGDASYCLLLRVQALDEHKESFDDGHIIWMKPCLFAGLPQDVAGYAAAHPEFPNETTGDQFFDEAQWESYRSLGHSMAWRLLSESIFGVDLLRRFYPFLKRKAPG